MDCNIISTHKEWWDDVYSNATHDWSSRPITPEIFDFTKQFKKFCNAPVYHMDGKTIEVRSYKGSSLLNFTIDPDNHRLWDVFSYSLGDEVVFCVRMGKDNE